MIAILGFDRMAKRNVIDIIWILLLSRQLSFLGVVLSCVVYYSIVYYVCYVLVTQTASYGGENYGGKAGCKKENFNGCALS